MHQETSCIKPSKFGVAKGVEHFPPTPSLVSSITSKNNYSLIQRAIHMIKTPIKSEQNS